GQRRRVPPGVAADRVAGVPVARAGHRGVHRRQDPAERPRRARPPERVHGLGSDLVRRDDRARRAVDPRRRRDRRRAGVEPGVPAGRRVHPVGVLALGRRRDAGVPRPAPWRRRLRARHRRRDLAQAEGPAVSVQASVAVVIPVHDGEAFLAETLASVAAQTLPAAEVIVVDDGSTDRSAAVARAAGARVLQQANAGPGAARNRGAAASTSELIAFLDADDLFEPDKLARQVAALASAPDAAGACSDALVLGGPRDGTRRNAGRRLPPVLRLRDLLHANPVIASSVVLRRSAFAAAGGFDEDPVLIATEDYD